MVGVNIYNLSRSVFYKKGSKCLLKAAEVSFNNVPRCRDEGPKCLFQKGPKCPIGAEVFKIPIEHDYWGIDHVLGLLQLTVSIHKVSKNGNMVQNVSTQKVFAHKAPPGSMGGT